MNVKDITFKSVTNAIKNGTADLLSNSDFISRTVGMNTSYDDLMFIVQALGREPISLLGKDYAFIFDHVRRNFQQGQTVQNYNHNDCPKFTFYKEVPTVRFADPYSDPLNLLDRWVPDMKFNITSEHEGNAAHGLTKHYSESNDGVTNNKVIPLTNDIKKGGNPGTFFGAVQSYGPNLSGCDLIKKTNDNFNHGKYRTLIARFHTNSQDSKNGDGTQSAISSKYGMSHGRNLLKINPTTENGYNNPYCRVWTYHHQYNQIGRLIRPFDETSAEQLESAEQVGDYNSVGFRTIKSEGFGGGSSRLDKYGVLNYENGFVNIAPTAKIKDYFEKKEEDKKIVATKKCMFSLENLAWRDNKTDRSVYSEDGLSPEQKGPFGGRIMWFPPYDLNFSEDVRVDWNGNKFIGRGEQIYTYTNTERSGNLSFTLLIDHPSIIDYWTGHKRNGLSNQGDDLLEGNIGGVDKLNNQENTLLRFFAGCDILSAKPQMYKGRNVPPLEPKKEEKPPKIDKVKKPDEVKEVVQKQIQVLLFYPNNYSGVDDWDTEVNPVWYLMNGVGAQKYVNETTKDTVDIPTYLTKITMNIDGGSSTFTGGYERLNGGISIASANLAEDYNVISGTYADTKSVERKAQYLTLNGGAKIKANYGGINYTLAKIVGSKAMSLGNAYENKAPNYVSKNVTGPNHLWYRRRYYYRVDKAYENQEFSNTESYLDTASHQLNATGYGEARTVKEFAIKEESDTFRLISFTDLFTALETNIDPSNDNLSASTTSKELKKIFSDKDRYEITSLEYYGHASYQGRKTSNNTLARNRANTLKKWLEEFEQFSGVESKQPQIKNQTEKPVTNVGHNSDLEVKLWRSASVIINYNEVSVTNAGVTNTSSAVTKVEIPNKEQSKKIRVGTPLDWLKTPNGQAFMQKHADLATKAYVAERHNGKLTWEDIESYSDFNYNFSDPNSWDYDDFKNQSGITITEPKEVERYDNEGEFFELLTRESPFLHHLISDKIKYFDPAYHSISPEGFGARLTFLHQCTRQGSTIENGSVGEVSAYNLAFGRPPVCILRLGDFYYTKIIINSLNINYDNPQWDLNPEGIGVMPMFAKISINFTFLGGSDLAGPIARLQNAVSFNYYANTSVYDNRAEMVEYDKEGRGIETKFKGFTYPSPKNK